MKRKITIERFNQLSSEIIEMPVSYTWRGYGSAIFLEFGKLHNQKKYKYPKGEASLMIEWSWRIENKRSIWFGSFSGDKRISNQLKKLESTVVKEISIFGRLPEICIVLDYKHWLKSFATQEGQPEWALFFPDKSWCCVKNGALYHENR